MQEGSITIGGHDVKEFTCDSLLKNMSMVFQNVYLFHDTIENNIKFGCPDATHEQVVEAAKKACCHDFISALPQGYDTVIGEGGSTLSGGEKQRIAIARMMLKNAPIVILDEATAFTDPENENKIQKSIEELTKGKTLLVIAHRLSTITDADKNRCFEKWLYRRGRKPGRVDSEQSALSANVAGPCGSKALGSWKPERR